MTARLRHLLISTTEDAFDVKAWSGIPHSLRVALEGCVERVSVFKPGPPSRAPLDALKRLVHGPVRSPLWITRSTLKKNARELRAEIARVRPDAVLAISSQTVVELREPGVPVFMFSDAPYWTFCQTYMRWETPPERIWAFAAEEAEAARRLSGVCFGSAWACEEAVREYGLEGARERVHETPLGANWVPDLTSEEVLARVAGRSRDEVELLYVGRDWERKGGPLAVEVARLLRDGGMRVRLHVVGCRPELGDAAGPEGFVTVHGALYQDHPEQRAKLAELFLRSHFLVVPTLAECFGIVFAEAQAFGLPPVSRRVDAIPSVVSDGETGLLFEVEAGAAEYAERIKALMGDWGEYEAMARRARGRFEERLNWRATANRLVEAMEGSLSERGS